MMVGVLEASVGLFLDTVAAVSFNLVARGFDSKFFSGQSQLGKNII